MPFQFNFRIRSNSWRLLPVSLFVVLILDPIVLLALEIPVDVKEVFEKATVSEDGMLNGPGGARMVLMEYMKENWAIVCDNLEEVAPTHMKKAVLIRASESLEAQEYFKFLKKMKDLRDAGRINADEFDEAIFPSRYKADFLPYNYQNSEIRAFVESIRLLLPTGRHDLNFILSGEMMKHREELRYAYHEGKFDRSLLLTPTHTLVPNRMESPSKPLSENTGRQSSSKTTNQLDDVDYVATSKNTIARLWVVLGILFVAAISFGAWIIRKR
jgi:hypothetical protein